MRCGLLVAAVAVLLSGCGGNSTRMYPVSGTVVLTGGDAKQLAGHHLEAALESDPTVRASCVIEPDGSFTMKTLHEGEIKKGAPEGKYQVRIVPGDMDGEGNKLRKPPVAPRHLKFETSGLSFEVPTNGDLTLTLESRGAAPNAEK